MSGYRLPWCGWACPVQERVWYGDKTTLSTVQAPHPVLLQVPPEVAEAVEAVKDNDEEVKKLGIQLGTQMCRRLLDSGAPGLHMYTLNLERSALAILENLGLIKKGRVGNPNPVSAPASLLVLPARLGNWCCVRVLDL